MYNKNELIVLRYTYGIISSAISTARDAPAATIISERRSNARISATAVPIIAEAR